MFTPGPLSTSLSVKQAMLRDLGSRDNEFIDVIKFVHDELLAIAGIYFYCFFFVENGI